MEDFFKQFKENLKNRPEPPFDERVWGKVEKSLDEKGGERRPFFAWWWVAVPLFAMLLFCNAWTLLELRETNHKFSELEIKTDTVFQKQIVYLTDTIYRTEVVRETIYYESKKTVQSLAANKPPVLLNQKNQFPINPLKLSSSKKTNEQTSSQISKYESNKNNSPTAVPDYISIMEIPLITYEHGIPELHYTGINTEKNKKNKSFREKIELAKHQALLMVPNKVQVGPNASIFYPINKNITPNIGYKGGFSIQMEYPSQFRLMADFQIGKTSFEIDHMAPEIGVPIFTPPDDQLEFILADVYQPFSQLSISIQQPFLKNKKVRPVAGLGLSIISLGNYDVSYEFEDPNSEFDIKYEEEVSTQPTYKNLMFGQLGIERNIGKHWLCQMIFTYRTNISSTANPLPKALGLQTNFLYEF